MRAKRKRGSAQPKLTKLVVTLLGTGLLLAALPVFAHHAFSAEFDINKPLTLKGTLSKWEMINPHSWFHIDVTGPDGKVTEWMIEGGSPNNLARKGWSRNSIKAGDKVSIVIHPLKNGENGGSLMKVTVNGTTLD